MKKSYIAPVAEIISLQTEAIMIANSGHIGGTIPGMGWGDAPESRKLDWNDNEDY